MKTMWKFLKDERGTETVEWAIIIGLIAVGAIVTAVLIGNKVNNAFTGLNANMTGGLLTS